MFHTTHWSVVLGAGAGGAESLTRLCQIYRGPVLDYIRRAWPGARLQAEDLAQAFFLKLIESNFAAAADPARGRFRAFLLTAVRRFVGHEQAQAEALKRGGGDAPQTLDAHAHQLTDPGVPPERAFDRAFALALSAAAWTRLETEARSAGKLELFAVLKPHLLESPERGDYAQIAARLGMPRGTVAVAIHRLRSRLKSLVREELAQTVSSAGDLEAELMALKEVLSSD